MSGPNSNKNVSPEGEDERIEKECRLMPFPKDLTGFVIEAQRMVSSDAQDATRNDLRTLKFMRGWGAPMDDPEILALAQDALVRIRITARTGSYPIHLLMGRWQRDTRKPR